MRHPSHGRGRWRLISLSAEFYAQLIARLDSLGLAVLFHKGKGLFEKEEKLRYRVMEHKEIRLEFADRLTVGVVDGPRELVSIGRYTPADGRSGSRKRTTSVCASRCCWTK